MPLPGIPIIGRQFDDGWMLLREAPLSQGQTLLLAHKQDHVNSRWGSPEPYVTWLCDRDGSRYQGHYYKTLEKAEADFQLRYQFEIKR